MFLNIKRLLIFFLVSTCCFSCNKQTEKPVSPDAGSAVNKDHDLPAKGSATLSKTDTVRKVIDGRALFIGEILRKKLLKDDMNILTGSDRIFRYTEADLNGDNNKEIFIMMNGSYFCGTGGCTVFLLNSKGQKISRFTVVGGPIAISSDKANGWADLIIPSRGQNYQVKYNGKTYPGNPTVQPEFKGMIPSSFRIVLRDNDVEYSF
ncbi:hypothetical protein [Chryseobacterium populi]|uniref:Uncharacterized protein n=1 Tax=Chryseobacterium populi TaxID=1144316 RepID=J2K7G3_9FLAO|nr:hypothetical protein [Chryseobacterium populi]EJL69163.1 hypothetical protein PMI13_03358 [Chryseobacterium populi]